MSGWCCGACGKPHDWRKPNRLLTLQIGDTMQKQVVFSAYGAPDGECDPLICALKLIANLTTGNQPGIVMQELVASTKKRIMEALRQFIAVDNTRALVTMGELAKSGEVNPIVLPDFDEDTYPHACVVEGDEVTTLAREEQGKQKLFAHTSQIRAATWEPPWKSCGCNRKCRGLSEC